MIDFTKLNRDEFLEETGLDINEIDIIMEVEYEMDDILHTAMSFVLTEAIHGDFILKDKNKKIVLFYRDKEGGGRASNTSKHANSVKIMYPADLKNITIEVPTDKNTSPEIKGANKSQMQKIKPAIDFVSNNARYLNAIFNSKSNINKRRAVKQIVTHNVDTMEGITFNDDNSPNDNYGDKMNDKLMELKKKDE